MSSLHNLFFCDIYFPGDVLVSVAVPVSVTYWICLVCDRDCREDRYADVAR